MPTTDALMTCDIARLEQIFAASRGNPEVLKELEDELRYRGPHALALLIQIHALLTVARTGPSSGIELDWS